MSNAHFKFWPPHAMHRLVAPATNLFYNAEVSARRYPEKACLVFYDTVVTFSDSGAHVGQISDANIHTHLLAYWVKRRQEFTCEGIGQLDELRLDMHLRKAPIKRVITGGFYMARGHAPTHADMRDSHGHSPNDH